MNINNVDIVEGAVITFQTKSQKDTRKYVGEVQGTGKFRIAASVSDVVNYHNEVLKVEPDIGDVEDQLFFIITATSADGETKEDLAFAESWINVSTVSPVTQHSNLDIRIYDVPSDKIDEILDILLTSGYSAKKI